MRRLFTAAFASMLVGVASGLFYREFTKINGFPEGAPTQLGLVHTHLLVLGFVVFLVVVGSPASWVVLTLSLFFVVFYSAPPLRLKERPVADSVTSSIHFFSPAVYGLVLAGATWTPSLVLLLVAFGLWGVASHAFGAVQDVVADREADIASIATAFAATLDDGDVLIDSHAILDHLDSLVPPEEALFPRAEPARRRALKTAFTATGLADKAVSLFYEQRLHDTVSQSWVERCSAQIAAALASLEAEAAARAGAFWFGSRPGHADIAVAVAWRFVSDVHPALAEAARYAALAAHAARLEALPVFQAISQPFQPPA